MKEEWPEGKEKNQIKWCRGTQGKEFYKVGVEVEDFNSACHNVKLVYQQRDDTWEVIQQERWRVFSYSIQIWMKISF